MPAQLIQIESGRNVQLSALGEAFAWRSAEVVARVRRRSEQPGSGLDREVEEKFEAAALVSTSAVALWIGGDSSESARTAGRAASRRFGELAAHRGAPLNEVTKRCLRWRDCAAEVLAEEAERLGLAAEALDTALDMLRRSFDVTLVRMCEAFEAERKRTHDELTEHQAELSYRATHDELTGLANRALVFDGVERALARAARSSSEVAVLFIDVDRFKSVNDTYGHAVGDHLLVFIAERLNEVVRAADMLGRLGGDEFVVVAEGISSHVDAEAIAKRVLSAVQRPFPLDGVGENGFDTSVSVGIAIGSEVPADEMLRNADLAMYRAKWTGRNRYVFYEPEMGVALQSGAGHEGTLHVAVEGEGLREI